ncbi:MAG: alpha/beta hydrolase [Pseudomonadota bacterium]
MTTDDRLGRGRGWASLTLRLVLAMVLLFVLVAGFSWARMLWVERLTPQEAAPANGRWIHAHDVDIHVQEFGDPAAQPLVLTHGTGAWSGTWDQNVQAMAGAGYRVIAIDLPPFGFSTRPFTHDYSRATQARRIIGLIDGLKLGPVTLLGHSYGGGPAAEAAMLAPDRVRHLILLDAAIGLVKQPPPAQDPGMAARLFGIRPVRTLLIATVGTQPLFSEFWLRQFVFRKDVVTTARIAIYQKPFAIGGFTASLGDWAEQFASERGVFASERPEAYRAMSVPLTLVWGQEDTITPLAQAQELKDLVANSKLVVLPGVGHIPQIEDPGLFNRRIVDVLKPSR